MKNYIIPFKIGKITQNEINYIYRCQKCGARCDKMKWRRSKYIGVCCKSKSNWIEIDNRDLMIDKITKEIKKKFNFQIIGIEYFSEDSPGWNITIKTNKLIKYTRYQRAEVEIEISSDFKEVEYNECSEDKRQAMKICTMIKKVIKKNKEQ